MRGKSTAAGLILILATVLSQTPAKAELVTIYITAEIDNVGDPYDFFGGAIKVGDVITGTYTYDSAAPDEDWRSGSSLDNIARYHYFAPPHGIILAAGEFVFQTDPANVNFVIAIANDYPSGGVHDSYSVSSRNNLPLSNGTPVDTLGWRLDAPMAGALGTDELTASAPILDDWQNNHLMIQGPSRGVSFAINAHVTSAVVVPEPATIALLAAGAALAPRRKPKKRKSDSRT